MNKLREGSAWTPERVELLKTLYAAGELSCNGIANELGGGISRNAVIGKAKRLGLTKKSPRPRAQRVPKARRTKTAYTIHRNGTGYVPRDADDVIEADVSSLTELEAQPPPATFLGLTLLNLETQHCRYPRTVDGATLFCGQPKIEDSSYCADCHHRCVSRSPHGRHVSAEVKEARLRGMRRALAERQRAAA